MVIYQAPEAAENTGGSQEVKPCEEIEVKVEIGEKEISKFFTIDHAPEVQFYLIFPVYECVMKTIFMKEEVKMIMISNICSKVQRFYLHGRLIYFYQIVTFGIYAIPGYTNSINKYGLGRIAKAMLLFSIVMLIITFALRCRSKQSFEIRDMLIKPSDCILIIMFFGYFLYFEYCSNIYVYLIPIFCTLLLILIKQIRLQMLPEDKE